MRNFIFTLIIIISFLLFSYFVINHYTNPLEKRELRSKGYYYVAFVIDGDTIIAEKNGRQKLVRLIGINAPEVRSGHRRKDECFGQEAKRFLRNKIEKKHIRMEKDILIPEKDRYNRLLRYIFFEEIFINKELISKGYAFSTTYKEHKFLDGFLRLEKEAKMNNMGLWKTCY